MRFVVMVRGFGIIAVCALGRLAGVVAQQAGDPMVLNIDYDVPSVSADDVDAIVRHSTALESELAKAIANRSAVRDLGFSALGWHRDGVPPDDAEIVLHVAAPFVGAAQGASLASTAERRPSQHLQIDPGGPPQASDPTMLRTLKTSLKSLQSR